MVELIASELFATFRVILQIYPSLSLPSRFGLMATGVRPQNITLIEQVMLGACQLNFIS